MTKYQSVWLVFSVCACCLLKLWIVWHRDEIIFLNLFKCLKRFNRSERALKMADTDADTSLQEFYVNYQEIHGYIASVICIFGIISNTLNIIVLSRKNMMTPTNLILIALAFADFCLMVTYLVYAVYLFIITEPTIFGNHTSEWTYFILCFNLFGVANNNIILWLTVSLAVFQYISVRFPLVAKTYCSMQRAKITIVIAVIATVLLSIPNMFLHEVVPIQDYNATKNWTGFWITYSTFVFEHSQYKDAMFWLYGVFMKVVPSALLTVLSGAIIHAVRQANQRRLKIFGSQDSRQRDCHETKQMTCMLLSIMALFVATQFPHGIILMISGLEKDFFSNVYAYLGDILDLLSLINSAMIFVIYCTMSKNFRTTFCSLFLRPLICTFRTRTTSDIHSSTADFRDNPSFVQEQ